MKRALVVGALLIIAGILVYFVKFQKTNSPPEAMDGSIKIQEDTPAAISLKGSDTDGDLLTFAILTKPAHGSLSGTEPNIIYTPEMNFNGVDSFTFKVSDGKSDSNPADFSIMVTAINDPPIAGDDNAEMKEDATTLIINVLENDTDLDKDQLTVLGATEGSQGSTVINNDNKSITYTPNKNFSGSDSFTYTISDGEGGTDTASVHIKIIAVNDAPVIRSKPVTTTRVWGTYTYDVEAADADSGDKLTYTLVTKPDGMSINSSSGLIEWKPTGSQAGTYDVEVKVQDSGSEPASNSQKFSVTVASLDSPLTALLTVRDGYNSDSQKILSQENKAATLQTSDNKWLEIPGGTFAACVFSDASLPDGATVASVVLNVEHFEDKSFSAGKLQWSIGKGWPNNAEIWDSINAPLHEGQAQKAVDLWDITSIVNTPEKLKSFMLHINNGNNIKSLKSSIDNIYVIVRWY